MSKYLIINADDFGMCHAANVATFDLFEKGGITSATVMTPCGWAPEAIEYAKTNPQFAVGVHLTFTSEWKKYRWSPILRNDSDSLRDSHGYMHFGCDGFEKNAIASEVEREIRAQIDFVKNMGLEPSHIDNHMGSLYGLEGVQNFLPLTLKICAELGYAYRMTPVVHPKISEIFDTHLLEMSNLAKKLEVPILDHLWVHSFDGEAGKSYESFKEYMLKRFEECPDGIVETYIHPSVECDELKNTSSVWHRRVWEYKFFGDPETRKHIEAQGIQLINYRDLVQLRSEGK